MNTENNSPAPATETIQGSANVIVADSPTPPTTPDAPAEEPCNCPHPLGQGLNHATNCPEAARIAARTYAENKAAESL